MEVRGVQSGEGVPSCRKGLSRQRTEHQSIVCGWPREGEQRRKKAGGGGCQELAATTPGFSALCLSFLCMRPGGACSRASQAGGRGQGWAGQSIRTRLLHPLLLPTPSQPPSPPLQTVPSRPHLPRTYERLTFKILWRTPSFTPYPSLPPSKKENSR